MQIQINTNMVKTRDWSKIKINVVVVYTIKLYAH